MKKAVLLLLCFGAMLLNGLPALGQTMEQAIAASFPLTKPTADLSDIVTAGAVMTLKKDKVIMFATTASSRSSLLYKDGKISPTLATRAMAFSFMGKPSTSIVQRTYVAGEKLWLIGVQTQPDGVNLQFLSDAVGDNRFTTFIKVPFPKGGTLPPQQVVAQVSEFISAEGGAAGAAAAPAGPAEKPISAPPPPPAPAEAPITAPPPPGGDAAAGGWRMADIKGGNEAMIAGTVISGGQTSDAVLGISCSTANGAHPLYVELRVRAAQVKLSEPHQCGKGAATGRLQLEGKPAEHPAACNSTADPAATLMTFQFMPTALRMKEIAGASGRMLMLGVGGAKDEDIVGHFQLPADMSQTQTLVAACKSSAPSGAAKH